MLISLVPCRRQFGQHSCCKLAGHFQGNIRDERGAAALKLKSRVFKLSYLIQGTEKDRLVTRLLLLVSNTKNNWSLLQVQYTNTTNARLVNRNSRNISHTWYVSKRCMSSSIMDQTA